MTDLQTKKQELEAQLAEVKAELTKREEADPRKQLQIKIKRQLDKILTEHQRYCCMQYCSPNLVDPTIGARLDKECDVMRELICEI